MTEKSKVSFRAAPIFLIILTTMSCTSSPPSPQGSIPDTPARSAAPPGQVSAEEPSDYSYEARGRVLTWQDGKKAACSLTFDDGTRDQYAVAAPILDTYAARGTFFLITGFREEGVWIDGTDSRLLFSWDQSVLLSQQGHEIGSHGVEHLDLRELDTDEDNALIRRELGDSILEIRRRIPAEFLPSEGGMTFCWPYWRTNSGLVKEAENYYLAARTGRGVLSGSVVRNPFEIHSVMVMSTDSFPAWVRKLEMSGELRGWIVFSFHGFYEELKKTDPSGWQPVSARKLEALLSHLRDNSFWVAPFGEVFRYAVERRSAELVFEEITDAGIVFSLEDGLQDDIYSQPLSVEIFPPAGMAIETARNEDGSTLSLDLQDDGWIRLDVLPDGSRISLLTAMLTATSPAAKAAQPE